MYCSISTNSSIPLALLREQPLFSRVNEEDLMLLASAAQSRKFEANQEVFIEGDDARAFYAIVTGEIELFRPSVQGDEKVFQILDEGELLAEAAMFLEPSLYPVTARATQETTLYSFPRRELLALCDVSPHLLKTMLCALANRLYAAVNRIEHLSVNSAGQRLVMYLMDLRHHSTERWIDIPVPISVLAGQLAMTPETLSRLLQKFRQSGLISGKGRTIVLLEVDALCDRVGIPCEEMSSKHRPAMVGCCSL